MTSDFAILGNILVVRDGRVVHESSHGPADPTTGAPLTPEHRFQIASISKQFTAAAILLLADAGKLAVTDPVSTWIADCPPSWAPVTIDRLLTHTSGLGHWEDYPEIDLAAPRPVRELVAAFQAAEPVIEPGSGFRYSSPGYCLLAHIVERAAGRPYQEFLTTEIFERLGLADTFVGNGGDRPDLAVGCDADGPVPELFELDFVGRGAGDVQATARDLVAWNLALAEGRLLSDTARRDAFAARVLSEHRLGEDHYYGYGWASTVIDGHALRYHTGGNAGFNTFNGWFPELSAHVILLSNRDGHLAETGWEKQRRLILDLLATAG